MSRLGFVPFFTIGLAALLLVVATPLAVAQPEAVPTAKYPQFDINEDNIIDAGDLSRFIEDWHRLVEIVGPPTDTPQPPTVTPVPPTATPTNTPLSDGNYAPEAVIGMRAVTERDQELEGIATGKSYGLPVVGVETYVYLLGSGTDPEGSDIVGFDWSISGPGLADATTIQDPVYQLPREGRYQVALQVTDASGGKGDAATMELVAGTWQGLNNCAACHAGALAGLVDKVSEWETTHHAIALEKNLDDSSGHFREMCLRCHTVGHDIGAANGGFDDVQSRLGWQFPAELKEGNWAALEENYPELANLGSVQCESCHGPGSLHNGDPTGIAVSTESGVCGYCHDAGTHHVLVYQWDTSRHGNMQLYEDGAGCVPCHSGPGFIHTWDPDYAGKPLPTEPKAIGCAACHDPHSGDHPHQVRQYQDVTLMNGVVVTAEEAGTGVHCIHCHKSRRNVNEYVQQYRSHFGPHYSAQGDLLKGTGGYEYPGVQYTTVSVHLANTQDSCVDCHMASPPAGAPVRALGEHSFRVVAHPGEVDGVTETIENLNACTGCHDGLTTFNRTAKGDYDGDGLLEGFQDEVEGLLHLVGEYLPPLGSPDVEVTRDYTGDQLKAAYNYLLAEEDRSLGIHNPKYVVQLLQSSYVALTGNNVPGADMLIVWPTATPTSPPPPTDTPTGPIPTDTPIANYPPEAMIGLRAISERDQEEDGIQTSVASGQPVVGAQTSVYLLGSGDDPEGSDITAYDWMISGPGLESVTTVQNPVFAPPRVGRYLVSLQVTDASGAQSAPATREIVSAKWTGLNNCAGCHDGTFAGLTDKVSLWGATGHASMLAENLDHGAAYYGQQCISCHTVGYDENADNGGFDDVQAAVGWVFPALKLAGNWEVLQNDYPQLANLANIQCENCHGPGSLHNGDPTAVFANDDSGVCAVCHDAGEHHIKSYQWDTSRHGAPQYSQTRSGCAQCHSGMAFIQSQDPDYAGRPLPGAATPIGCAACHDPHSNANEHQIRVLGDVTLANGVVVPFAGAGTGTLCMNCHKSRRNVNTYVQQYADHFGPHYGPQADMLAATGGYEWAAEGENITISFSPHSQLTDHSCVECHMAEAAEGTPARAVGQHTFRMTALAGSVPDVTETYYNIGICQECHRDVTVDFDRTARGDYDGDGTVEGIQSEVAGLLEVLGRQLPPLGDPAVEVTPDYTGPQLKAAYNYEFVHEDRSLGIHQTEYAIKLLQVSYRQLTGSNVPGATIR